MAAELSIGGTGNALGTMRLLADAYMKAHPHTRVVVQPSIGSSGALRAVPQGALDIGLVSRELTDDDRQKGLRAIEYARSLTVIAVHRDHPARSVTRSELVAIFTGRQNTWADGTLIRPVLRQPGDDNIRQLRALGTDLDAALAAAEKRSGLPYAMTDQDAADKIVEIPGAIGTSTLALILSEARPLRALAFDGVAPTVAAGRNGSYPLVKRYFALTRTPASTEAASFVSFLASPVAQDLLVRNGHWAP